MLLIFMDKVTALRSMILRSISSRLPGLIFALSCLCLLANPDGISASPSRQTRRQFFLDNHGHKLHLTLYSPSGPIAEGLPTIVFESGLGNDGTTWSAVVSRLPLNLKIVTYDRPGLGLSEADGQSATAYHCAEVLHRALSEVTAPPFVLVGHSWGGPRIRTYAGMYPDDVAGLVFVDPTDFTMTSARLREEVFGPLGHPEDGENLFLGFLEGASQRAGGALEAERQVFIEAERQEFSSLRSLPMPDVPLVTLVAELPQVLPPELHFPFNKARFDQLFLANRLKSLSAFTQVVSEGTFVATPNSSHYIQADEPELVAWAIKRTIFPDIRRRLLAAFHRGQAVGLREELRRVKQTYPANLTTEDSLNTIGYFLLASAEKPTAVALFKLIARYYSNSWNAYDSLAEAVTGDRHAAIRDYKKSLALDPKNENARRQIAFLTAKKD